MSEIKSKYQTYRERKIARLGIDEFRKQESEKRQARRLSKNPKAPKVVINQNDAGLDRLHKYLNGEKFENYYDVFKDTKKVIQAIENNPQWKSPNTKNKYLENLSSVFKNKAGWEKEYKAYSKASVQGRKKITKSQGDLKMTDKEAELFIPWTIIKKTVKYQSLTDNERALIGLYTLMPPRRRSVAQHLTLANERTTMLSPNLNYLVGRYIIINNYKTSKVFKQQKFKIPIGLHRILLKHIQTNDISFNSPVFPTSTGKYHNGPALSTLLSDIFEKTIGKRLTFNSLRHSFIMDFLGNKKTLNQKKRMAKRLAHSVCTQAMYDRMREARN
jgi:hypothetical protein